MAPTIGRIVLYRFAEHEDKPNHSAVAPAVIVCVWNERCVNLHVLPDGPKTIWATSVEIEDEPGQPGRWSWPARD